VGEMGNACIVLIGKQERGHMKDLSINGRIIF
jgi:hypothetical protein